MPHKIDLETDLRPAYYDDFHCLAAGCRLSCCKGWRISFNKKDYLSLKRQTGTDALNARMENGLHRIRKGPLTDIHFGEFDMSTGDCPLLREDCLCALQLEKGHEALPAVCRIFPRAQAYQPSGCLEKSLSPACEGVLELLWNLPDGVEFRSDPLPKAERKVLTIADSQPLVPFFPYIREWCVDMLQDRRHPLPERILRMGAALRELAEGETDIPAWLVWAQALMEQPGQLRNGQTDTLTMLLSNHLRTLLQLNSTGGDFREVVSELTAALGVTASSIHRVTVPTGPYLAALARYEEQLPQREYYLENLMVSLFFHLRLPHLSDRDELWKGYVNLCNLYSFYHFMAVMSCREGVEDIKQELFRLTVFASRSLIHNGARQHQLRDEFFQNDSATLAHMAILLGG